ncbi:Uncharacterised protein [Mycobacteroides abscessus subsp. abscessus]|nr:Uncharacterised protein [Mycobacteroides abscessus subsp. abscessus]
MWSGDRLIGVKGLAAKPAAAATRSWPTSASSTGTGPSVSTRVNVGTLATSAAARSTNCGVGSMTSVVILASAKT